MYTGRNDTRLSRAQAKVKVTEAFPCFFLSCKANSRVTLATTGHGPQSSKLVVICVLSLFVLFCCYCVVLLLFVLFCCYLCCYMYCLCVNVYCTTATGCLPNCSWQIYRIISYHIISYRIVSYHIISYHISYHIISYHIIYHIIYHIASYHIISYHISYHIEVHPRTGHEDPGEE